MTSTPIQIRARQTKLGHRLRQLAERPQFQDRANQLLQAAANLDNTCASLGLKGEAIKTTGAYRNAVDVYYLVTGSRYAG